MLKLYKVSYIIKQDNSKVELFYQNREHAVKKCNHLKENCFDAVKCVKRETIETED